MDILEKIELFIGEEISGSPAPEGGTPGTTTSKVAKYHRRQDIINRKKKKKKKDAEDSEQQVSKGKTVKSGSHAMNGLGATAIYGGLGSKA